VTKKEIVAKEINLQYGYDISELLNDWEWKNISEWEPDNVFWDNRGIFVIFADHKVIWYDD
jgi:hypothetical protein